MTIYRGVGGGGNATTDSEIALLTQLEQSATAKAAEAAASALVAEGHADDAADSAAAANASKIAAASSASSASSSATAASNSASSASTSASNAASSEAAAALSETAAETAQGLAEDAQTAAETAQGLAEDAQAAAEAAQAAAEDIFTQFGDQYLGAFATDPAVDNSGNALTTGDIYFNTTDNVLKFYSGAAWVAPEDVATTAATEAAASALEASGYADDASGFADAASASASAAANSASAASTSASNAATSESNAASSASAAATSASNASTSETNAAASASSASTSASNAATSETNAASSASTATTQAGIATTQAGNAATSASAAAISEANAATSATNAATSAQEAADSATAAATFDPALYLTKNNPSYTGTLTGGTGVINIGSGQLYKDASGNVGIGTDTPDARLHVIGTSSGTHIENNTSKSFATFDAVDDSPNAWNSLNNATLLLESSNNAMAFLVGGTLNNRQAGIQVGHEDTGFADILGTLALNPFGGNVLLNNGYGSAAVFYGCRAWVNFNGTGTVAIRASGNVSSITDNGTGDYTVNFTTAMPDANYAVQNSASSGSSSTGDSPSGAYGLSTSSVSLYVYQDTSNTLIDRSIVCVSIFR
jgi:hypothetical protein